MNITPKSWEYAGLALAGIQKYALTTALSLEQAIANFEAYDLVPRSEYDALAAKVAEVRACGAVWVCPEAEWSDDAYAGTWTCALPLGHGGPNVEPTRGIRWQERGRLSDEIGEFYPPNAVLDFGATA